MASKNYGRIRKDEAKDSLDSCKRKLVYSSETEDHLHGEQDKAQALNMEDSVPGQEEELNPVRMFVTKLYSVYVHVFLFLAL